MSDMKLAAVRNLAVPRDDEEPRDSGIIVRPAAIDSYSDASNQNTLIDDSIDARVVRGLFGSSFAANLHNKTPEESQRRRKVSAEEGIKVLSRERTAVRTKYSQYLGEIAEYRSTGNFANLCNAISLLRDAADASAWINDVRDSKGLRLVQFAQFTFYKRAYDLSDEALNLLMSPTHLDLWDRYSSKVSDLQQSVVVQLNHLSAVLDAGGSENSGNGSVSGTGPLLPAAGSGGMAAASNDALPDSGAFEVMAGSANMTYDAQESQVTSIAGANALEGAAMLASSRAGLGR